MAISGAQLGGLHAGGAPAGRAGAEIWEAAEVKRCLTLLLDRAEHLMRAEIAKIPDGEYHGRGVVEDDGQGSGVLEIRSTVCVTGDEMAIQLGLAARGAQLHQLLRTQTPWARSIWRC